MRTLLVLLGFTVVFSTARGQSVRDQAGQLEDRGEVARAEQFLRQAASSATASPAALEAFAEFLDRHGNSGAREAYEKFLATPRQTGDSARRIAVARRLVLMSLEAGDTTAAAGGLARYREAGGKEWPQSTLDRPPAPRELRQTIEVPGPLPSFRRMASVSQDVTEEGLLLAVARTVVTSGYQAGGGKEGLVPTEYLKLLTRYLSQARELARLAGAEKRIRVDACDSPQAADLLRTLGFRMRGGCGSEVVLETVNASRAFLTIDSGFPLADLEQSLRTNRPFSYDYRSSQVPVLWSAEYWMASKEKQGGEFIDALLADPSLCRFYLGMSKPDAETVDDLRKNIPAARLRAFAHVFDFFGSMLQIREGRAVVPGGARSARMWEELVGVSPDQGARFIERLVAKDDGWMASYFDALSRLDGPVADYLTEPERIKRFYTAIRGRVTSPGPARPVFQSNTDMLLLTARLRLDPDGRPHIPGGIGAWKTLFINHPLGKYDAKLTRLAASWKEPDDVLEALFALCRKVVDNEPLKIFMAVSDLERHRTQPLEGATVERLVHDFRAYGDQYSIFSEATFLKDAAMVQFLDTAAQLDRIANQDLRADAVGSMQALVGLWQILSRQGTIPASQAEELLAAILSKFANIRSSREVFDAGRSGVELLLKATGTKERAAPQQRLLDLLAGGTGAADAELQGEMVAGMLSYLEVQKLVPLDLLFEAADQTASLARGDKLNTSLASRLAARVAEIESPRSPLTSAEKNSLSFGYWTQRHIDSERRLNFRSLIEKAGRDAEKLQEVRGSLAPLLRDTLVGLNYVYYAPPGGQLLRTSASFVRSHDFFGLAGSHQAWQTASSFGIGWPSGAGGRLEGSLVGLPYALAQTEQNFLIPDREQALIWGDLVPQMLLSATVPRWWNVSASQLHWVALHQRYAASLLAEAALDSGVRSQVLEILARQAVPARVRRVAGSLERGDVAAALREVTPVERFVLAKELSAGRSDPADVLASRMRRLAAAEPDTVNYAAVSRAFGTPKPTLTGSYRPELLYLRTFPALLGYSSRLLAESWESNTLYWAALADEVYLPPAQLNISVPEWTRDAVQRIFASHLEDWPAVLQSLYFVGEDVRSKAGQRLEGLALLTR